MLSYQAVRTSVRESVRPSPNARLQLDLDEKKMFAYVCVLVWYVSQQIFSQIVCVLDLHFQGKRFESSTSGSSYVIISQTVTDRTNIAFAKKMKVTLASRLAYLPLTLAHSNGQVQGDAPPDKTNIAIANKYSRLRPFHWHIYI